VEISETIVLAVLGYAVSLTAFVGKQLLSGGLRLEREVTGADGTCNEWKERALASEAKIVEMTQAAQTLAATTAESQRVLAESLDRFGRLAPIIAAHAEQEQ
jgi:hypothetical protein